jgi:hypothetical protein
MKRLQEVHDQLIANTGSLKPLVVVRFNPDSKDDIEEELKRTLVHVFEGTVDIGDDRGIILHKLVGYGRGRKEMYDNDPLADRITML